MNNDTAYNEGFTTGYAMGGDYTSSVNPYTSFAPGVEKHRAYRAGYLAGSAQRRQQRAEQKSAGRCRLCDAVSDADKLYQHPDNIAVQLLCDECYSAALRKKPR
jgi:hypothetical protein